MIDARRGARIGAWLAVSAWVGACGADDSTGGPTPPATSDEGGCASGACSDGAANDGAIADVAIDPDGGDATTRPKCSFALAAPIPSFYEEFRELHFAQQADCKILLGGGNHEDNGYFSVVQARRLLADAKDDTAFANGGTFRHSFTGLTPLQVNATEASRAYAIREVGGKLVLAGQDDASLFMMRLTSSGALDPTFNGQGVPGYTLIAPPGQTDAYFQVDIGDDGSAFFMARTGTTRYVLKATPVGAKDTSFATQGVYSYDGSDTASACGTFAVSKDEKHLFACVCEPTGSSDSIVLRRYAIGGALEAEAKVFAGVNGPDASATSTFVECGTIDLNDPQAVRVGFAYSQKAPQQLRNVAGVMSVPPTFTTGVTPTVTTVHDGTVALSNTATVNAYAGSTHIIRASSGNTYVMSGRAEINANLTSYVRRFKIVRLAANGSVDGAFAPIERESATVSGTTGDPGIYAVLVDDFDKMIAFYPNASTYVVRPEN